MTAAEFLQQLAANLQCLQEEERASAMAYYHEYFEEAGEENEMEAVERLGSPQSVAERIIMDVNAEGIALPPKSGAASYAYEPGAPTVQKDSTGRVILAIVLIILTFPFWIAIPIVWFTFVFLLVFLPFTFFASGIAAVIQSIFKCMTLNVAGGIWDLGGGLFLLGLTMLIWYPFVKLAWTMTKGFGKMCAGIFKFLCGKE
ncbi:MAG: DUF1700 domain-containing protein [Ruminococcus sp.]|nr:DUF1700 domain-containing protein [Ruminococcus sp.]